MVQLTHMFCHVKRHVKVLLSLLLSNKLQVWIFIKDAVRWCLSCFNSIQNKYVFILFRFVFCIMGNFFNLSYKSVWRQTPRYWTELGQKCFSLWTQITNFILVCRSCKVLDSWNNFSSWRRSQETEKVEMKDVWIQLTHTHTRTHTHTHTHTRLGWAVV